MDCGLDLHWRRLSLFATAMGKRIDLLRFAKGLIEVPPGNT